MTIVPKLISPDEPLAIGYDSIPQARTGCVRECALREAASPCQADICAHDVTRQAASVCCV